jgi:hypothetical protein
MAPLLLRRRQSLRCLRYKLHHPLNLAITQPGSKTDPDRATEGTTALSSNILQGRGRTAPNGYHSLPCIFFTGIVGVSHRACGDEAARALGTGHLRRQMRQVVGLRGVILEGTLSDYPGVVEVEVEGPGKVLYATPNVFLKRS